jgi:hypothetical protein
MNGSLFAIPQEGQSLIARMDGDTIIEVGNIDIPYTSKSVATENGYIVSICFGNKPKASRLKIFDSSGRQLVRKTEYKYRSIACKNNVVYLGGQFNARSSELFACIDLTDVTFTAEECTAAELALPTLSVAGKAIDDTLIRNNRLILVDNVMYPKYLFEYDITTPNAPKHIATEELPNNGTYEHIIKGDINDDYLALLSSSVGRSGSYTHITISGKRNVLLRYLTYSVHDDRDKLKSYLNDTPYDDTNKIERIKRKHIFDIALIGDYLFILGSDGLECLDLRGETTKSSGVPIPCGIKGERLLKTPDNRLVVINKREYELVMEGKEV